MREEMLKALKNEELVKKIMHMKTKEEVVKALTNTGITPTDAEVNELGSLISGIVSKLETLPENELESVAGGTWGGFGEGLLEFAKIGKEMFISTNQTQAKKAKAHGQVASSQAQASMVRDASIATIVVAAAAGVYAFRNEIKDLWYSDKK